MGNDSGADVAMFGVLGVASPAIRPRGPPPATAGAGFAYDALVVSGVAPVLPEHAGRFVVV
ncbi:MAG: hypothetical protein AAGI68_15945, partial [Planctomycetota bacterium]